MPIWVYLSELPQPFRGRSKLGEVMISSERHSSFKTFVLTVARRINRPSTCDAYHLEWHRFRGVELGKQAKRSEHRYLLLCARTNLPFRTPSHRHLSILFREHSILSLLHSSPGALRIPAQLRPLRRAEADVHLLLDLADRSRLGGFAGYMALDTTCMGRSSQRYELISRS